MPEPTPRVRYFDRQFLHAVDFTLEQEYLRGRMDRNLAASRTPGRVSGLTAATTDDAGVLGVLVAAGTAVDPAGRLLTLAEPVRRTVPPASPEVQAGTVPYDRYALRLSYRATVAEPSVETGEFGETRWIEQPDVDVVSAAQAGTPKRSDGRVEYGAPVLLAYLDRGADWLSLDQQPPGELLAPGGVRVFEGPIVAATGTWCSGIEFPPISAEIGSGSGARVTYGVVDDAGTTELSVAAGGGEQEFLSLSNGPARLIVGTRAWGGAPVRPAVAAVQAALMPAHGDHDATGIRFQPIERNDRRHEAYLRFVDTTGGLGLSSAELQIGCGPDQVNDALSFVQGGAERLRIDGGLVSTTGPVGIGTDTPGGALEVRGGAIRPAQGAGADTGISFGTSDIHGYTTPGHHGAGFSTLRVRVLNGFVDIYADDKRMVQVSASGVDIAGPVAVTGDLTVFNGTKSFAIDHPVDPGRRLVHACLEGPESAVYYRGEESLVDGRATVRLPAYFEALTRAEGRTVQLTPIYSGADLVHPLAASAVRNGQFGVRTVDGSPAQHRFYWQVTAVREDLDPLKVEVPRETASANGPGGPA